MTRVLKNNFGCSNIFRGLRKFGGKEKGRKEKARIHPIVTFFVGSSPRLYQSPLQ